MDEIDGKSCLPDENRSTNSSSSDVADEMDSITTTLPHNNKDTADDVSDGLDDIDGAQFSRLRNGICTNKPMKLNNTDTLPSPMTSPLPESYGDEADQVMFDRIAELNDDCVHLDNIDASQVMTCDDNDNEDSTTTDEADQLVFDRKAKPWDEIITDIPGRNENSSSTQFDCDIIEKQDHLFVKSQPFDIVDSGEHIEPNTAEQSVIDKTNTTKQPVIDKTNATKQPVIDKTTTTKQPENEPLVNNNKVTKINEVQESTTQCLTCWKGKACKCVRKSILPLIGLVLYFADVGTDVKMAHNYHKEGQNTLLAVTLTFVLVPALATMLMDISWVFIDGAKDSSRTQQNKLCLEQKKWLVLRAILSAVSLGMFGRSYRIYAYWWMFIKANLTNCPDKKKKYKYQAMNLRRDCYMMSFIEAFLESTPQLFIQLYIIFAFNAEFSFLRVGTLSTSILSIAWTYAAYYRSNRAVANGREDVTIGGLVIYVLAALCCLVSRFISIVFFSVYFKFIGLIAVGVVAFVHILVLMLYISFRLKPPLADTVKWSGGKYMYYAFFAYVNFFLFMNLREGKTRRKMLTVYSLISFENIVMISFLVGFGKVTWGAVLLVGLPSIFHVVLISIFYGLLHPKTGRLYGCSKSWYCGLENLF